MNNRDKVICYLVLDIIHFTFYRGEYFFPPKMGGFGEDRR
jgi:hypothetical protein